MKAAVSSRITIFIVELIICILNSLLFFLFSLTSHCSWYLYAHCLLLATSDWRGNFVHSLRKRGGGKYRKVKAHCWNHRNLLPLSWEQIHLLGCGLKNHSVSQVSFGVVSLTSLLDLPSKILLQTTKHFTAERAAAAQNITAWYLTGDLSRSAILTGMFFIRWNKSLGLMLCTSAFPITFSISSRN